MNQELSWGYGPWASWTPWKFLHMSVRRKWWRRKFLSSSVTKSWPLTKAGWLKQVCVAICAKTYLLFPEYNFSLGCFRGNLEKSCRRIESCLFLQKWLQFLSLLSLISSFPSLPFSDDQRSGNCPNSVYISEWWSLIFLGLAEETFLSPLLNIEHHLGVNEFRQRDLVLQPGLKKLAKFHFLLIFLYNLDT